jgi:type II secretory pathway pseudopilin PulG
MDPQVIGIVATTAVGFLASYLTKASEATVKLAGEDIYQAIKARLTKKPAAQEALGDLAKAPDDADLQASLRVQLKKLLAEDADFAGQLQRLLQEAGGTEAGATIIRQTAGDHATQFGQVFGNVTFGQG